MAPFHVKFDSFAQVTGGLVAYGLGPTVSANGVALVTGFLFAEIWNLCGEDPVTSWTACASNPSTTWSASYSQPVTAWTLVPGG